MELCVIAFYFCLLHLPYYISSEPQPNTLRPTMITTQFSRFLHLSTAANFAAAASKANLAKLRKKTGYPFGNCKKALEANNNDLEKAEKWLEEQAKALGWSKAMKMESRNTPQGLVGVAWDHHSHAAIVEVNCETDFVARNDKFQKLVDLVAKTCLLRNKLDNPKPVGINKSVMDGSAMGALLAGDDQSLADHVARSVGMVGERMVLRRAALISAGHPVLLTALTHPASPSTTQGSCQLGKYGAVLMYEAKAEDNNNRTTQLAKQLCQHVIGMNPLKIEASADDPPKPARVVKEKPVTEAGEEGEGGEGADVKKDEEDEYEESVMMRQTFLLDPDRTVADVVAEGGITLRDFVRFECGGGAAAEAEPDTATVKVASAAG